MLEPRILPLATGLESRAPSCDGKGIVLRKAFTFNVLRRALLTIVPIVAMSATGCTAAPPTEIPSRDATVSVLAVTRVSTSAEVAGETARPSGKVFDWATGQFVTPPQPKSQEATVALRNYRRLGRGSYICSPSGFGKRSRCFSR